MSKEAMKLALDLATMHHTDAGYTEVRHAVRSALREALAERPATYTCGVCGVSMQMEQPAQQQLDHTAAANAALRDAQNRSYQIARAAQQQENYMDNSHDSNDPVALEQERKAFEEWIDSGFINKGHAAFHKFSDRDAYCIDEIQNKWKAWKERAKRTTPQAQPAQRKPWVGLTDEQIKLVMDGRGEEGDDDYVEPVFDPFGITEDDLLKFARAIESAHNIGDEA